jgi:Polyketide cyclase / dehydrase and lipid transport
MSHLSTTLSVDAPADVVYDLVADPSRAAEWQTLLAELGSISGRPGGIGSSYVGYYRVAGRKLEGRFVVTAAERPSLHQVNGTTTGGWTRWTTIIEPDGRGSLLRISLEYELPGEIVGSLFGMLTGNRIEREFRRSYQRLREILEEDAGDAGSPPILRVVEEPDPEPDELRAEAAAS